MGDTNGECASRLRTSFTVGMKWSRRKRSTNAARGSRCVCVCVCLSVMCYVAALMKFPMRIGLIARDQSGDKGESDCNAAHLVTWLTNAYNNSLRHFAGKRRCPEPVSCWC